MLQSISWQSYFTFCILILLFYYAVVFLIYYRLELVAIFRQPLSFKKFNSDNLQTPASTDDQDALVSNLKDELIAYTETTGSNSEKAVVLFGLKKIINKYTVLKGSPFSSEINATIIMSCENNCAIILNEEETGFLWNG